MHMSPMVCSLMYGGLVSTGPTSYRISHIMNSTNPWIHSLNEFIYNWKSPISLLAQSCAVLVALRYLAHLVIFPSVHISSACVYVCSMYQASKMAWRLVWFELCCVNILVWCEMCCVELPLWHLLYRSHKVLSTNWKRRLSSICWYTYMVGVVLISFKTRTLWSCGLCVRCL